MDTVIQSRRYHAHPASLGCVLSRFARMCKIFSHLGAYGTHHKRTAPFTLVACGGAISTVSFFGVAARCKVVSVIRAAGSHTERRYRAGCTTACNQCESSGAFVVRSMCSSGQTRHSPGRGWADLVLKGKYIAHALCGRSAHAVRSIPILRWS